MNIYVHLHKGIYIWKGFTIRWWGNEDNLRFFVALYLQTIFHKGIPIPVCV